MSVINWLQFNTVATSCALAFYIFLLLLFVPRVRHYFGRILSLPTPSTKVQLNALDSIRGLSATIVALAHMWYFCQPIFDKTQLRWFRFLVFGGNKAVPIFVILSGFLIYKSVRRLNTMNDLKRYFHRRFLRLYPVYLFTLLICFLIKQYDFTWSNFLSSVFMLRAINLAYFPIVNPPAWSLYVEVLFYVVLPMWVIIFKKNVKIAAMVTLIILLFTDSLASREMWLWKYFFVGILTAELVESLQKYIKEWHAVLLFILGSVLLMLDFKINRSTGTAFFDWFNMLGIVPKNQAEYTVGLGFAVMFILIGMCHSPKVSKLLSVKPLRILGVISYSLYLIHPIFVWAVFPNFKFTLISTVQHLSLQNIYAPAWYLPFVMLPGCLIWAIVCFLLVERPFMMLKPRVEKFENLTEFSLPNQSRQIA